MSAILSRLQWVDVWIFGGNNIIHPPVNLSPPGQNGRYFADDIFNFEGPIDNKGALFQVMTWHRTGDKPLSESMLT